MTPTATPTEPTIRLPEPEQIRAAIDSADERARLLRRLLRLALRLRLHLASADGRPSHEGESAKGGRCG